MGELADAGTPTQVATTLRSCSMRGRLLALWVFPSDQLEGQLRLLTGQGCPALTPSCSMLFTATSASDSTFREHPRLPSSMAWTPLSVLGSEPDGPSARTHGNRQRVPARLLSCFAGQIRADHMKEIAKAAGVGARRSTRYPTVSAVAEALLDEHERVRSKELLSGLPPLGPGAEPAERLAAFYRAMVDLLEVHAPLVLGSEVGASWFSNGAYRFWRAHVGSLLREHGTIDDGPLADVLLAPLALDLFIELRAEGSTAGEIAETLEAMARRVLA